MKSAAAALAGCLFIASTATGCGGGDSGAQTPTGGAVGSIDGAIDDSVGGDGGLAEGASAVGDSPAGNDSSAQVDVDAGAPTGPTALVHFLGRFDTSGAAGPRFAWPGSAIAASFTGTGVDVKLHDAGTNYFSVVIDGGAATTLPTSSASDTYTLASNLAAGQHTVLLTKKTESYVGVVQYLALTPHGGQLVPSPDPFARRIETVGDSITCGYGDLGMGPSCHFSDDTEDETLAYGALAAAQLSAQHTAIAYSGIGMYRDGNGSTTDQMPARFGRTLADDAKSVWGFGTPSPDVVVINLSTNDFAKGDPGMPFEQAYVTFLQGLRAHYPLAYVIGTLGPMLSGASRTSADGYIQGAIQQLKAAGDARVSYLAFDVQQAADGYGCDYHPSPKTHELMAGKLVPAVRALTGW